MPAQRKKKNFNCDNTIFSAKRISLSVCPRNNGNKNNKNKNNSNNDNNARNEPIAQP